MIIIKRHKGIGDTVAAITKATRLDKLVGEDCGCGARQEAWNDPGLLVNRIFYGTKQNQKSTKKIKAEIYEKSRKK